MATLSMKDAITDGLRTELKNDEKVLVFGEDVGHNGGVFRVTDGLQKEFGEERVFDTPLAESGIGGLAIGLGIQGYRPVMEIQFIGFIFEVFDSIAGQASRLRYRTGGRYHAPMVIRTPFGGGVHAPDLHPDSLEGLITQTPGIRVVVPSNAYDAKGLLISAIRNNDPVFFMEHLKLYMGREGKAEVPDEEYTVPLDKANVVREGNDVSIFAYGAMVHTSLKAAEQAEKDGVSVEVIDLRTISPLDTDTILKSVQKTNRAIVVQEAQKKAGIAAELIAQINEKAILHLEAPVQRVSAPDTVYAFPTSEAKWLPDVKRIKQAIDGVMNF